MKKINIRSVDLHTYMVMVVNKWKNKSFIWHKGHLNFLKYAYYTSVFWRLKKTRRIKRKILEDYRDFHFPQMKLGIFDKKIPVQKSIF